MRGGARRFFCGRRRAPFLAGLPFFGKAAPPPFSERLSIFLCRAPSSAVRGSQIDGAGVVEEAFVVLADGAQDAAFENAERARIIFVGNFLPNH